MVSIEYTVTDGSKSSDRVASAVVARNSAKKQFDYSLAHSDGITQGQ